eukprot:scaffold14497_cov119-Cylindrotheca_fusiformis.AAC.8
MTTALDPPTDSPENESNRQRPSNDILESVLNDLRRMNDYEPDSDSYEESSIGSGSSDEDVSYCSSSDEEYSDCSAYDSLLSTILEETEHELDSWLTSDDESSICEVGAPRSISLDAFFARDARRRGAHSIDTTSHDWTPTSSQSGEDSPRSSEALVEPERQAGSPQHPVADNYNAECSSACSESPSSSFNFKLAKRRLQRNLSAKKFRDALGQSSWVDSSDEQQNSSFDSQEKDRFLSGVSQPLPSSPAPNVIRQSNEKARENLINAMANASYRQKEEIIVSLFYTMTKSHRAILLLALSQCSITANQTNQTKKVQSTRSIDAHKMRKRRTVSNRLLLSCLPAMVRSCDKDEGCA